eukprot:TRINITY_DN6114_c0_g1_i4.p1 TRINITY_DN6114_c0_g1~~TRINITY_DN6114_c0_g1_i4.p1  ORF type:complete len:480 (+),score=165.10 TRINITY_DN6114_c0_g1_i4:375-1814(+)
MSGNPSSNLLPDVPNTANPLPDVAEFINFFKSEMSRFSSDLQGRMEGLNSEVRQTLQDLNSRQDQMAQQLLSLAAPIGHSSPSHSSTFDSYNPPPSSTATFGSSSVSNNESSNEPPTTETDEERFDKKMQKFMAGLMNQFKPPTPSSSIITLKSSFGSGTISFNNSFVGKSLPSFISSQRLDYEDSINEERRQKLSKQISLEGKFDGGTSAEAKAWLLDLDNFLFYCVEPSFKIQLVVIKSHLGKKPLSALFQRHDEGKEKFNCLDEFLIAFWSIYGSSAGVWDARNQLLELKMTGSNLSSFIAHFEQLFSLADGPLDGDWKKFFFIHSLPERFHNPLLSLPSDASYDDVLKKVGDIDGQLKSLPKRNSSHLDRKEDKKESRSLPNPSPSSISTPTPSNPNHQRDRPPRQDNDRFRQDNRNRDRRVAAVADQSPVAVKSSSPSSKKSGHKPPNSDSDSSDSGDDDVVYATINTNKRKDN